MGKKHLLFDTETTGLVKNTLQPLHKQPQIIEIYMALIEETKKGWKIVDEFESYLDPKIVISDIITKITGITDADVKGAPTFRDVESKIRKLIESADVVVAHNLSYDMQVTNFEFMRVGDAVLWPAKRICTVEATEHIKGHRLNLTALHTHLFGEGFPAAHRARTDVEALTRCYQELVKRGEV